MATYLFISQDAKWCSHLLTDEQLCKILKLDLFFNPAVLCQAYTSKGNENTLHTKTGMNDHNTIIYNPQVHHMVSGQTTIHTPV